MKTLFLFICLSFLALFQLSAQNQDSVTIKNFYEENAIWWDGATHYFKNHQAFPLSNLKNEIRFSPEAINEYNDYRRNKRIAIISIATSGVFLVSGVLAKDQQTKIGLLTGGLLTATFSLPFTLKSSKHLGRAIWLHNRDVLLK